MTQPVPTILALDLSLTATGYCRDGQCGRITTKLRDLAAGAELVVLEGYSFGSQGRAIFQIGELGGVVRFWLWGHGLPTVEVAPSTLKKFSTGKGNCGKDAMIAAAIRRFGFEGCDNNEADAYLIWCLARHGHGDPVASVPIVQAAVAEKIEWPAPA